MAGRSGRCEKRAAKPTKKNQNFPGPVHLPVPPPRAYPPPPAAGGPVPALPPLSPAHPSPSPPNGAAPPPRDPPGPPLRDGTAIILRILRESGKPTPVKAAQGAFQQMLGGKTAQMMRVRLAPDAPCVPEISANKYMLNIRFLAQGGEDTRTRTADWDVDFELTFCNL